MLNNYKVRKQAGDKQESEVAYQLDRLLKRKKCKIIHDLRLTDGEYNAQIDHLIIHKYGFIIIESKSIKGSVTVNNQCEWSRSIGNRWEGMPSPIKQVEMQYKLLNGILDESAPQLVGKILGIQKQFGGRVNDIVIAISSNAIFNRIEAPDDISKLVLKTEFVADHVVALMDKCGGLLSSDPWFSKEELLNIYEHLTNINNVSVKRLKSSNQTDATTALELSRIKENQPVVWHKVKISNLNSIKNMQALINCKSCSSSENLRGAYGKFGYYVQCDCGTNTSMKLECISCGAPKSRVKIKKKGTAYSGVCNACASEFTIGSFKPIQ
ncbi:nuclease-related domain-containing protein [Glaciecola sp. MF2-115]|uniref:nuclease-related domain-containing protein n=1 Tax=Glaciecola sp. MF2-115 TaxID=3384827 RepID=UPI0039A3A4C1